MTDKPKDIVYGHGPDILTAQWTGPFHSREEATQHGRSTYGTARGFYITKGEPLRIEDFVPGPEELTHFLLEEVWLQAYSQYGDHADAFPESCDVTEGAKAELHFFIKGWVQRRLPNSWAPVGSPDRVEPLTQLSLVPNPVSPYRTARQAK